MKRGKIGKKQGGSKYPGRPGNTPCPAGFFSTKKTSL